MTAAAIIQARMGSSRLPGKVLMDLGGQTALEHCLRRARAIPGIHHVVCAIPDGSDDDLIAAHAASIPDIDVVRGSGPDVLARYHKAAHAVSADWIIRITSDCPLIDPVLCGRMLGLARLGFDVVVNNHPPSWPHGLDAEVFSATALDQAFAQATDPFDREHVGPWIRRATHLRQTNMACDGDDLSHSCRWTLDYPEDYQFLAALFRLLPPAPAIPSTDDVLAILAAHPDLSAINAVRRGVRAVGKA